MPGLLNTNRGRKLEEFWWGFSGWCHWYFAHWAYLSCYLTVQSGNNINSLLFTLKLAFYIVCTSDNTVRAYEGGLSNLMTFFRRITPMNCVLNCLAEEYGQVWKRTTVLGDQTFLAAFVHSRGTQQMKVPRLSVNEFVCFFCFSIVLKATHGLML